MTMAMRRLGVGNLTVHGMRSAARSRMADNGVEFELAEACLAHAVGNPVVQANQRSSMLERRRQPMQAWASFVSGKVDAKVMSLSDAETGTGMIRIAISVETFEAIAQALPVGSMGSEANERGERLIWLAAAMVDRLGAMRGPGESYSDVILRLAEIEARGGA
jgi:hypothetical protein